MCLKGFRRLYNRGDTIVEVFVVIAVLSLVLGGAFVATNRNLQDSREAQERVNALKLVEAQVEQIKNLSTTNPVALFGATNPYCITNLVIKYPPACTVGTSGVAPLAGEPAFDLTINESGNTFTIKSTWKGVRSDDRKLEIKYRAYQ